MNITIDAATATILSAIVVGAVSLLTTLMANIYTFQQQKAQWRREEARAIRDEMRMEEEKQTAYRKELSNRLQEIYGNSIANLTALLIYTDGNMRLRPDYQENLKEAQKWVSQIVAIYYDKESNDYDALVNLFNSVYNTNEGYTFIEQLRSLIIRFTAEDPRL